jgi:hypothetical protein
MVGQRITRRGPANANIEGGLSRQQRYSSGGKPTRYRCRLCGLLMTGEGALLETYQHHHEVKEWQDWKNTGSIDASVKVAEANLAKTSKEIEVKFFDTPGDGDAKLGLAYQNEVDSEYRLVPQEFIGFTQHLLARLRYTEGILAKYRHASITEELGKAYNEYKGVK